MVLHCSFVLSSGYYHIVESNLGMSGCSIRFVVLQHLYCLQPNIRGITAREAGDDDPEAVNRVVGRGKHDGFGGYGGPFPCSP